MITDQHNAQMRTGGDEGKAYGPEVSDDLILLSVAPVIGVLLPVLDVDISDTSNEQFELTLVEDVDEIWGDELVEAGHEGVELFFNAFLDSPFGDESVIVINGWSIKEAVMRTRYTPSCSRW